MPSKVELQNTLASLKRQRKAANAKVDELNNRIEYVDAAIKEAIKAQRRAEAFAENAAKIKTGDWKGKNLNKFKREYKEAKKAASSYYDGVNSFVDYLKRQRKQLNAQQTDWLSKAFAYDMKAKGIELLLLKKEVSHEW